MSRKSVSKVDFYFEDFLTGTSRLSSEHLGVYIRIICILWSHKCIFEDSPDQDVWLAQQCGMSTRKFRTIKQVLFNDIDGKFTIKDGCYFNERVFSAYKSSLEIKRVASEKGAKGALKRWEKEQETAETSQSVDATAILPANAQAIATTTTTSTIKEKPIKKKKIKKAISEDWQPSSELIASIAEKEQTTEEWVKGQVYPFVNFWIDNGEKRAGWDATFRNRCRNDYDNKPKLNGHANGGVGNWVPVLEKYLQTGFWDEKQYQSPLPVIDGFYNPDCQAPKELIKDILGVGDLL